MFLGVDKGKSNPVKKRGADDELEHLGNDANAAALFIRAEDWNQHKGLWTEDWLDELWFIPPTLDYAAVKNSGSSRYCYGKLSRMYFQVKKAKCRTACGICCFKN